MNCVMPKVSLYYSLVMIGFNIPIYDFLNFDHVTFSFSWADRRTQKLSLPRAHDD